MQWSHHVRPFDVGASVSRARLALVAIALVALPVLLAGGQPRPMLFGIGVADPLFDERVLHDISLFPNASDWALLKEHYLENTYYPADFLWRDQMVRGVGIRSRGTGSRSGVKPGLLVDFDRYRTGQRFLGLNTLVLRNNTQDPSNMHERLTMKLFARLSVPASRESYARLFVNGEYLGLYTIVEAVDEPFLKRTFGDDGGYLFDYDYPADAAPYRFEDRGSDAAAYVPQPFKPQTHSSNPRPEFIVQLVEAINRSGDAVFRQMVEASLDVDRFLRHVAVEMFVGNNDGVLGDWGMNNFFLYRLDGQAQFHTIPWDQSNAFVNAAGSTIWHNITDVPAVLQNRLVTRMMREDDLRRRYLDLLAQCVAAADERDPANPAAGTWLEREIAVEYDQIRQAALADVTKPFTNDEFERSVADVREFARTRGAFVTTEIAHARGRP